MVFSLKSVIMTVRSPTVTSKCCALLLSTFFNRGLAFLLLFFLIDVSFSLFSFSVRSFFSFFDCMGGTNCCVTCCETNCETGLGFRVEVPLRTSHIRHLKASALFLKVHTLQSQYPSSDDGFGCRFGLVGLFLSPMLRRTTRSRGRAPEPRHTSGSRRLHRPRSAAASCPPPHVTQCVQSQDVLGRVRTAGEASAHLLAERVMERALGLRVCLHERARGGWRREYSAVTERTGTAVW